MSKKIASRLILAILGVVLILSCEYKPNLKKSRQYYKTALGYLNEGDTIKAEIELRKAIQADTGNALAHSLLAHVYKEQRRYDEAENELQKAIALDSTNATYHNNLATVLRRTGDYIEAEIEYRAAIELNPDKPLFHNNLGHLYSRLHRYEKAEEEYLKAIELDSQYTATINNLGFLYFIQGEFDKADSMYRKAIGIDPGYLYAYDNLGFLYCEMNQPEEAELFFRKALEQDPAYTAAHNHLGYLYYTIGKLEDAERECLKAVELNPSYAPAYYVLGLVNREMGDLEGAEINYRKAREFSPIDKRDFYTRNLVSFLVFRSSLEKRAIDLDGAILKANQGLEILDESPLADKEMETDIRVNSYFMLGCSYLKKRQYGKAIAFFHKVLDLEPENASAMYNIAYAYIPLRRFDEAELAARSVLALPVDTLEQDTLEQDTAVVVDSTLLLLKQDADSLLTQIREYRQSQGVRFRVRWWQFAPLVVFLGLIGWVLVISYKKFPELFKKLVLWLTPILLIIGIAFFAYPLIEKLSFPGLGELELDMTKLAPLPEIEPELLDIKEPPPDFFEPEMREML